MGHYIGQIRVRFLWNFLTASRQATPDMRRQAYITTMVVDVLVPNGRLAISSLRANSTVTVVSRAWTFMSRPGALVTNMI